VQLPTRPGSATTDSKAAGDGADSLTAFAKHERPDNPRETTVRAYLIAALLLLLIFGGISGYLYQRYALMANTDFTPPPVAINAGIARLETWQGRLEAVGTIKAQRGVQLNTEESGEITAIRVASGAQVRAGDLLLTLNDKVEQASRERQEANLKLARLLFERDAKLVTQKSIPQSQYDRSRADLDSAIAQLAETEARLENKRIHAPFDGVVGIIHVKPGDYVTPGTRIATLQDLSALEVDFTVPVRHYPELRRGQEISVSVAAYPDRQFRAALQAVDSQADPGTRNLLLRATIKQGEGLLPGMFARLTVELGTSSNLVTVPETAVTYSLHGNVIWVITSGDGGDRVSARVVRAGPSREGEIAILEGLESGERIVTSGQNKLVRDAAVTIGQELELSP
jgi:membrane fusion protein (multidrug efflux system)